LERRIADEKTKNCSLEKANSELREQLEVQRKAHQEQLKEQKKHTRSSSKIRGRRTKVSHCFPRVLAFINLSWILKKLFTTELRKMLIYKEELLTDVKNLLYQHTDDIERLQKVIGDTEQQFVDCLQQIKTLGEKDEQRQKELEDLSGGHGGSPRRRRSEPTAPARATPRSPEESAQIPLRSYGRVRQQRPCNCEVLFAGRATRDICSGNGGRLHRGII
jgi:hypothetical protein